MLTVRTLFRSIHDSDEAYRLFCSIAAQDENQGGWENERIAALVKDQELAPKIARHGADERKHGRIFAQLLRRRGLEPVPVPPDTDYCMLLERQGIGLLHERLRSDRPLDDRDVITYLVHSRVTEQRAAEEMRLLARVLGDHPEIGRAVRLISADEANHLAYCQEELLRFADQGHSRAIRALLRQTARVEIRTHRDVGLAVMRRMGDILGWPRPQRAALAAGLHLLYLYEAAHGWRRMVRLRLPAKRNAMGVRPVPVG
ncbi:ferritin-like domain-containing protein [Peterkaempfera bronchialis]|uniref:Ferritin-like domain-containing protein n=1 Tax=Peterkaempfera bronchialis TaxID=2126346 RepID=A0A345ST05_9ACTN|nr:ferritin-like domain-containing protein [Peterkaempfera bronchialis]AXI76860.1 ferritin-like domain-containing protein [Peterkaempfera bronchialis]